ncbi:unnamed protein product [[Actinomadura] parvosata subsp. kistnae]|nr:unnamed protein product [Actinomadura parvosata subsp. kistnae]
MNPPGCHRHHVLSSKDGRPRKGGRPIGCVFTVRGSAARAPGQG